VSRLKWIPIMPKWHSMSGDAGHQAGMEIANSL
jgi:hypothetical protein